MFGTAPAKILWFGLVRSGRTIPEESDVPLGKGTLRTYSVSIISLAGGAE